jgi:hypothetical protein
MKTRSSLLMFAIVLLALIAPAHMQAQTTYLPYIVDGGNWYTAIMINNTGVTTAVVNLTFFQRTTGGVPAPWIPPFVEMSSTNRIVVAAGGVVYIHTPGIAQGLTQGWGQVTATLSSVEVTAIYTYKSFAGRPDQDGTSPATAGSSRVLLPFDETTGYSTGVAIVNPTGGSEDIVINIETDSGVINTSQITLPSNGLVAFDLGSVVSLLGHRGQIEFVSNNGTIAVAAFRINPTVALTSIPVTETSGSAILGATGFTSLPQFTVIKIGLGACGSTPCAGQLIIYKSKTTSGYAGAILNLTAFPNTKFETDLNLTFTKVIQNGLHLGLSAIDPNPDGLNFVANFNVPQIGNLQVSVGTIDLAFVPHPDDPSAGSVTALVDIPDFLRGAPFSVPGAYSAQ